MTFNLRYPGQYFDKETKLHYNYFRSYDSRTGRYTQGDPIGLDGGWNRFGYVDGNPLSYIDPTGKIVIAPVIVWGLPIVGGIVWGLTRRPPWGGGGGDENTGPYCKVDEFDKNLCDDYYENDRDACFDKFGNGFRGGAFESNLRGCLAWAEVRRNACYRGQRDPGPYAGGDSWPGGRNR